jgi:hypothetical protein
VEDPVSRQRSVSFEVQQKCARVDRTIEHPARVKSTVSVSVRWLKDSGMRSIEVRSAGARSQRSARVARASAWPTRCNRAEAQRSPMVTGPPDHFRADGTAPAPA